MRVHSADAVRDYEAGETHYREPGHYLEAASDAEYLEISRLTQRIGGRPEPAVVDGGCWRYLS